jgi:hypothetical protein
VTLVALLAAALNAQAAAVGQTSATGFPCVGPYFVAQTGVGATPSYLVPPGRGVITAWSLDNTNSSNTTSSLRLKLVRPVFGLDYAVVAQDTPRHVSPSVLNTFSTRIPVSGGEVLALWIDDLSVVACEFSTTHSGDIVGAGTGSTEPQPGETVTVVSSGSVRLNVSARVEPDADGDGYGDETQDACPQDPAVHVLPCAADQSLRASATPATIGLGDVSVIEAQISDRGPGTSLAPSLDISLGRGLRLLSSDAVCTFASVYSCPLGPLAPATSATRLFVVKGTSRGKHAISVATRQSDVDPRLGNNSQSLAITVEQRAKVRCTVPNLIGLSVSFARLLLHADHCALGKIKHKHSHRGPRGRIVGQTPRRGTRPAGSAVAVTVRS